MPTIVTIGHILCETIIYADGRTRGPVLGGPAAYGAVVCARLGIDTGIVTKVGADAPPGLIRPLKRAGVDLSGVDRKGPDTTTNQLIYANDGTKELKYLRQARPITWEDIPAHYQAAAAFHVCPLDYEVPVNVVSRLAALNAAIGVDLGGYGGAHVRRRGDGIDSFAGRALEQLLASCTIAKASDEDAALIFRDERLTPFDVVERLIHLGVRIAIVTLGAAGSLVATRAGSHVIPAIGRGVRDVTGAGDSFMAGFLAEFVRTADPVDSAYFAAAVARHVIQQTGGVRPGRMPRMHDVRSLLVQARGTAVASQQ